MNIQECLDLNTFASRFLIEESRLKYGLQITKDIKKPVIIIKDSKLYIDVLKDCFLPRELLPGVDVQYVNCGIKKQKDSCYFLNKEHEVKITNGELIRIYTNKIEEIANTYLVGI